MSKVNRRWVKVPSEKSIHMDINNGIFKVVLWSGHYHETLEEAVEERDMINEKMKSDMKRPKYSHSQIDLARDAVARMRFSNQQGPVEYFSLV